MKKITLSLGAGLAITAATFLLLNHDQDAKAVNKEQPKTDFIQENKKTHLSSSSTRQQSPVQSSQKSHLQDKKIADIYQNYRGKGISLSDANEAQKFLKEMYIPSHKDEEDFTFIQAKYGTNGSTYYNFQQTYKGLEVYGSEVSVQVSSDHKLESVIGKYSTALQIDTRAKVQGTVALQSTLNLISNADKTQQKIYQQPELVIYMDYDDQAHLAYESIVKYSDPSGDQHIDKLFIDANSAELIDSIDRIHTERDIDIYTLDGNCVSFSGGGASLPGTLARNDDSATGTVSVDNAYDFLNDGYYFYKHMFNRFSYDANDATVVATVDAKFSNNGQCSGLNAFFSPDDKQLAFGTGDSSTANFAYAADVVAHELTHAVTWKTSNLEYKNESGALNESISDIFGVAIQTWAKSGGGANGNPESFQIDNETWLLGEQLDNTRFIRYLNDPTKDDRSPDNYDDRYTGSDDNGGVHSNSGITNLSFALLVEGGTHPQNETTVEVTGIGMEKAIRIWYEAQTTTISTRTDFDNIRASLANAATSLYEECSPEYKAVQLAMDAVKMPGSWECAEPDTTAPTIASISPSNGTTNITIETTPKVTFNEPMDADTLSSSNIFLSDTGGNSVAGTLSVSGQSVTFTPQNALAYDSSYTFNVTTGVNDVAGNALQNAVQASFTTVAEPDNSDTTAPTVTSVSPADNTVDVATDSTIAMRFSEAVNADALTTAFSLKTASGESVSGSLNVEGSDASFTPANPLLPETSYTATISTALEDLSGNALESAVSWSFTTLAETTPPDGSGVSLADATLRASSQYNYSYSVENIRDGKLSSEWVSQTNYGGYYQSEWVQIDLPNTSRVQSFTITWNGYYFPQEMQLWAMINGSWQKLQEIRKYTAGETSFSINEDVESIHLAMRGGRYGSWFVIKEVKLD